MQYNFEVDDSQDYLSASACRYSSQHPYLLYDKDLKGRNLSKRLILSFF
jgi:hypothetical protein